MSELTELERAKADVIEAAEAVADHYSQPPVRQTTGINQIRALVRAVDALRAAQGRTA